MSLQTSSDDFVRSAYPSPESRQKSNLMPCANGNASDQLMVLVWRRMYALHASEPDSRPPPVSFSPPNAPPISAPEVPMLTLAMPQSLPIADRYCSADFRLCVKIADDNPCGTSVCMPIASSSVLNGITYRIGAKVSVCTISSEFLTPAMIVGSTKLPLPFSTEPPLTMRAPPAFAVFTAATNCSTAALLLSGPISVSGLVGSPIFFSTCWYAWRNLPSTSSMI